MDYKIARFLAKNSIIIAFLQIVLMVFFGFVINEHRQVVFSTMNKEDVFSSGIQVVLIMYFITLIIEKGYTGFVFLTYALGLTCIFFTFIIPFSPFLSVLSDIIIHFSFLSFIGFAYFRNHFPNYWEKQN